MKRVRVSLALGLAVVLLAGCEQPVGEQIAGETNLVAEAIDMGQDSLDPLGGTAPAGGFTDPGALGLDPGMLDPGFSGAEAASAGDPYGGSDGYGGSDPGDAYEDPYAGGFPTSGGTDSLARMDGSGAAPARGGSPVPSMAVPAAAPRASAPAPRPAAPSGPPLMLRSSANPSASLFDPMTLDAWAPQPTLAPRSASPAAAPAAPAESPGWWSTAGSMAKEAGSSLWESTKSVYNDGKQYLARPWEEQKEIAWNSIGETTSNAVDYGKRVANAAGDIYDEGWKAAPLMWQGANAEYDDYTARLDQLQRTDPEAYKREIIGLSAKGAGAVASVLPAGKLLKVLPDVDLSGAGKLAKLPDAPAPVYTHLTEKQFGDVMRGEPGVIHTAEGRSWGTLSDTMVDENGKVVNWGSTTSNAADRTYKVVYEGQAAELFRPVEVVGVRSGIKRAGGQYYSDVGKDIRFTDYDVSPDGKTVTVRQAEAFTSDRQAEALRRNYGTKALEVATTAGVAAGATEVAGRVWNGESWVVVPGIDALNSSP